MTYLALVAVAVIAQSTTESSPSRAASSGPGASSEAWFCVMPRSEPFDECPLALPDDADVDFSPTPIRTAVSERQKQRPSKRPRFRIAKGVWLDFHHPKWRCVRLPDKRSYVVTIENYGKPFSSFRVRPHSECPRTRVQDLARQNMYKPSRRTVPRTGAATVRTGSSSTSSAAEGSTTLANSVLGWPITSSEVDSHEGPLPRNRDRRRRRGVRGVHRGERGAVRPTGRGPRPGRTATLTGGGLVGVRAPLREVENRWCGLTGWSTTSKQPSPRP